MKFICGKFDLQLSDDMEKKKTTQTFLLFTISIESGVAAADRTLAHMNKWSGVLWQIPSACLKGLDASILFLCLCFCTCINPWLFSCSFVPAPSLQLWIGLRFFGIAVLLKKLGTMA